MLLCFITQTLSQRIPPSLLFIIYWFIMPDVSSSLCSESKFPSLHYWKNNFWRYITFELVSCSIFIQNLRINDQVWKPRPIAVVSINRLTRNFAVFPNKRLLCKTGSVMLVSYELINMQEHAIISCWSIKQGLERLVIIYRTFFFVTTKCL